MVEFRSTETAAATHTEYQEFFVGTTRCSIATEVTVLPHGRFVTWCANRAVLVGKDGEDQLDITLPVYVGSFIVDIVYYSGLIVVARHIRGQTGSRLDAIYCCPLGGLVPFATQMVSFTVTGMVAIARLLLVYSCTSTVHHIKCFGLHRRDQLV